MPEPSPCRSCQAPLLWVRTVATGLLMPLDAEPHPEGNIVLKDGMAYVLKGDLFEEMMDGPRYRTHFVTCPNAQKHRKRK